MGCIRWLFLSGFFPLGIAGLSIRGSQIPRFLDTHEACE